MKSKNILSYLRDLLKFFEIISLSEFEIEDEFLKELLNILNIFPNKDIIHLIIFKILSNKSDSLNKNPKQLSLIAEFIMSHK